jgi:hypothetical protein
VWTEHLSGLVDQIGTRGFGLSACRQAVCFGFVSGTDPPCSDAVDYLAKKVFNQTK